MSGRGRSSVSCNSASGRSTRWTRAAPLLSGLLLGLTLLGCSATSSGRTSLIPSTPILESQKIVVLDGTRGWWIDERDAAALAQWIHDVEEAR